MHSEEHSPCREIPHGVLNCSGLGLTDVPRFPPHTRVIDLSRNNITMLNESFTGLQELTFINVSNNKIESFHVSDASCLESLETLDLSVNRLHEGSFPVLKPSSLRELRIQFNTYKAYPEEFISELTCLRTLHIDVFGGFKFGNAFLMLQNLTEIEFYARNPFTLRNDSFLGLNNTQITLLNIYFRSLAYDIEVDTFSPFLHLQELTLNIGIRCNIVTALRAMYGLRHRRMRYLNLAKNYLYNPSPIKLREKDINYLSTMCISRIDLSVNYISSIPYIIADSRFANCLEEIKLGDNNFRGNDLFTVFSILSYRNIRVFDFSFTDIPHLHSHKINREYSTFQREINVTLTGSNSLRIVNMSGVDFIHFSNTHTNITVVFKGLEIYDAAFTRMFLCQNEFDFSFDTSIKYLDVTGWECDNLDSSVLSSATTLETLICRNTDLSKGLERDPNGVFLRGLFNLTTLDLGNNGLKYLHHNLLKDQSFSLQVLNLQDNALSSVPLAIRKCHRLKTLNIQGNAFSSLTDTDIQILEDCKEALIRISRNPFVCICDNLFTIQWFETNKARISDFDGVICTEGVPLRNITENIRQFELKCLSTFWLEFSASLCIVMILVVIASVICYRYRVYVEYLYLIFVPFARPKPEEDNYQFDGFISYSTMDAQWVTQVLYKRLTQDMNMNICIHDKDFIPGRSIASEILRCIDQSRKVIFVVTRNFLGSDWGNYELEMARIHAFRSGRSGLLIILKDDLAIEEMPDLLKRMWWKIVCMKWPNGEQLDDLEVFWHNIKIAMET